jgi:clan AA aspartic protease (TIGR02281 family)
MEMSKFSSVLILSLSLIAISLAPMAAVAQSGLPPCPPDVHNDLWQGHVNVRDVIRNRFGTHPPSIIPPVWTDCQGTKTVEIMLPGGNVVYAGEFKDDKPNGRGTQTWPDGRKYVGEFKDGLYDGQGTYTFADGRTLRGLWRTGKFVNANSGLAGIPVEIEGGTFVVPVTINGQITLKFIVDTGASDVTVPADVVLTLIRTGSIVKEDFLGEQRYQLADGSTVPSPVFIIRSLKVGDKVLENVRASVASVKGGLLLGQSFLSRFGSWSVDNKNRLLFLN